MKDTNIPELEKELLKNDLSFVIFSTEWCGDCKMMMPFLLKLEEKYQAKVKFYHLDAEKESVFRDGDTKYKVLKVPTMILFRKDVELNRGFEFIPMKKMSAWIDNA